MRKRQFMYIVLALVFILVFSACEKTTWDETKGGTTTKGATAGTTVGTTIKATTEKASVQERPVVVMWMESRESNPEDVELVHDYIQEQSGVQYEVRTFATREDYINRVNVALAGNEDIDIISLVDAVDLPNAKQRGAIMKLNDLLDKYGQNIKAVFDEEPWMAVTDNNGDIWAIPQRQWGFGCLQTVRKDWREQLGMEPISSIEDLEEYMRAVKTADFDGNEVDDTFPMTTFGNPTKTLRGYDDLFRTLGYCVIEDACTERVFLDTDGKIKPVYMHPKYKDFVALLNRWHAEGLLHPELYSITGDQVNDLIMANKVGSTSGWYSNHIRPMNTLRKELDPDAYYEFIKPDTITGKPYSWWRQSVGLPNLGIVSYSDNAEWAIKLLDWMVSSEDNYWTTKFGIPGVHWQWIDQSKGHFEYLKSPDDLTKTYNYAHGFMFVYGKGAVHWEDRVINPDVNIAEYYKARDFMFDLPGYSEPDWFVQYEWSGTPVELSMEEGETLMGESIIRMIIGDKPLDDWDALIEEYRKIHADTYIELANIAYQKYLPKK